ncbi:hypothetical protein SUDANB95_05504 [Actinosynnema sp. ALI-1.44]
MDAIFGPMFDYLGNVLGVAGDQAAAWWPAAAVLGVFVGLVLATWARS